MYVAIFVNTFLTIPADQQGIISAKRLHFDNLGVFSHNFFIFTTCIYGANMDINGNSDLRNISTMWLWIRCNQLKKTSCKL